MSLGSVTSGLAKLALGGSSGEVQNNGYLKKAPAARACWLGNQRLGKDTTLLVVAVGADGGAAFFLTEIDQSYGRDACIITSSMKKGHKAG